MNRHFWQDEMSWRTARSQPSRITYTWSVDRDKIAECRYKQKQVLGGWNGIHCLLTLVEHDSGGIKGLLLLRAANWFSSPWYSHQSSIYARVRDRESMCVKISLGGQCWGLLWCSVSNISLQEWAMYTHQDCDDYWERLLCVVNDTTITVHPEMTETNVYFVRHGLQLDNFIGVRTWQWFLFRWLCWKNHIVYRRTITIFMT